MPRKRIRMLLFVLAVLNVPVLSYANIPYDSVYPPTGYDGVEPQPVADYDGTASDYTPQSEEPAPVEIHPASLSFERATLFDDERLRLQLVKVYDDNRCPEDLECFMGGTVKVIIKVRVDGQPWGNQYFTYINSLSGDQEQRFIGDYVIKVVGVHPNNRRGKRIRPHKYFVSVRVFDSDGRELQGAIDLSDFWKGAIERRDADQPPPAQPDPEAAKKLIMGVFDFYEDE